MARHVKSRTGWNGRDNNKIAHGTGLLGIVRNILGLNQRVDISESCIIHGRIEDSTRFDRFAAVTEAEVPLRRLQMLR
jgi:hypothetical protein